jgi:hypothetical protein
MRLFRSEEHVERTVRRTGIPAGVTFPVDRLWTLARLWFADRLSPQWRRRTMGEAHAIFEASGLTGPFWRIDG